MTCQSPTDRSILPTNLFTAGGGIALLCLLCCMLSGCSPSADPDPVVEDAGTQPGDVDQPDQRNQREADPPNRPSTDVPDSNDPQPPSGEQTEESPPASANPTLDRSLIQLASTDPLQRERANAQLAELGSEMQPTLFAAMSHTNPAVRRGAAYALSSQFDPYQPEMVDVMIEALDDDDAMVQQFALQTVSELESYQLIPAIPLLTKILVDADEPASLRAGIARRLGQLEDDGFAALPHLCEVATSAEDRNLRAAALYSIYKIATLPGLSVPTYQEVLLSDDDPDLRRIAAMRIGNWREGAVTAIAELLTALNDDESEVRLAATVALGKIGPAAAAADSAVVDRLRERLTDSVPEVQEAAEMALYRITGALPQ